MFRKIALSLALASSSLAIAILPTLARPARPFVESRTLYPEQCTVVLEGEKYYCDNVVIGVFDDRSGNIKLCSREYCFILIVDGFAFRQAADGHRFPVDEIAFQEGDEIVYRLPARLQCALDRGIACLGTLNNGSEVAIYAE